MSKTLLIVEDSELNRLDAGCDDFASKPIDDLLLVEMVDRLLVRR